jgi:xylitol oxidase
VLPDDTLISMASGGDEPRYALSFISYARPSQRAGFFQFAQLTAQTLAALYNARPHWGKVCPLSRAELDRLYPRLDMFRELCRQFDPQGAFRNAWMEEVMGGETLSATHNGQS